MPHPRFEIPPEVPYTSIDVEVRRLVQLMNAFPGIQTYSSCAGHQQTPQTEVGFRAGHQGDLCRLIGALPFLGARAALLDQPILESIYVTAELEDGCVGYKLRITGAPRYHQRELLMQVEDSLVKSLEAQGTHPVCSECG